MGRAPIFLAREGYRRRRLADTARLLPVLGAVLFLVPALDAGDGLSAAMLIYLFAAWGVLILASALLARRLCRARAAEEEAPEADP